MNKQLLSLIIATFVTTAVTAEPSTPAAAPAPVAATVISQIPATVVHDFRKVPATKFADAEKIKAQSKLYKNNENYLKAEIDFKDRQLKMDEAQAIFERHIQTGFFVAAGAATTLFVGCLFAEWLQEFKMRKAEKAKLVAELEAKAFQIKAACR